MEVFQLCGRISGLHMEEATQNFNRAEQQLRAKFPDAIIINPLKLCDYLTVCFGQVNKEPLWEHYLDTCFASLTYITHLITLPDAHNSKGGIEEMREVFKLGKYIVALEDMLK